MVVNEDPFACFDDGNDNDDDDDDNDAEVDTGDAAAAAATLLERREDCGVLAFHPGTEQSLLVHVQNELRGKQERRPSLVLELIDKFCMQRHWMMHVGPEKGQVLRSFLTECLTSRAPSSRFVLLELGTYCGYSSMLWAELLKNHGIDSFMIYTVEASPANATVARRLIDLAGIHEHISVLVLDLHREQTVVDLVKGVMDGNVCIDFVFLDHDKDAYLSDLCMLERSGLIRAGTHVAADNVVFARIDAYRDYVKSLVERGIVESRLVEGSIEYSGPDEDKAIDKEVFRDGIGTFFLRKAAMSEIVRLLAKQTFVLTNMSCFHLSCASSELTVYLKDPC
jgi:catechol O-methyltransferase